MCSFWTPQGSQLVLAAGSHWCDPSALHAGSVHTPAKCRAAQGRAGNGQHCCRQGGDVHLQGSSVERLSLVVVADLGMQQHAIVVQHVDLVGIDFQRPYVVGLGVCVSSLQDLPCQTWPSCTGYLTCICQRDAQLVKLLRFRGSASRALERQEGSQSVRHQQGGGGMESPFVQLLSQLQVSPNRVHVQGVVAESSGMRGIHPDPMTSQQLLHAEREDLSKS
mmetsp:Transcript_47224/g.147701  ORF Transcript_47224/g.147701 Transcript_47224/m.147701 type:complete len:221 (-) Transcript_47224:221-883(-)